MHSVIDILRTNARDNDTLFVFPSEVAASFWRRKILDIAGIGAVRADRLVSWDTFKEGAFPGREGRRPVNTVLRILFVRGLLRRNRENPVLRWFIPPEYASSASAFSRSLRVILPNLKAALEASGRAGAQLEADLLSDLRILYHLYGEFLVSRGFYEPNFEDHPAAETSRPVYLFFPELIEDYPDFRQALEATGRVRTVTVPDGEAPHLEEYDNSFQEIRGLVTRVAALLDTGVPAADILVTFPGVEDFADYLAEQALVQGVPLRIRQGRSVSSFPGGGFFSALEAAEASGFHVNDLKRFLLDGAFPWKDPVLIREVTALGIAKGCCGSYTSGGARVDPWRDAFRGRGGSAEGREFYGNLAGAVRRIRQARSFSDLRTQTQAFAALFFDLSAWRPEPLRAFQFALGQLAELAAAEKDFGGPVDDPFGVLAEVLGDRIYVPRAEAPGVDVYPYRVSAGVYPAYHFIVNACHERTRAVSSPFAFLREDCKEALGLADRDLSDSFLSLYCRSGENVSFSYSREPRGGAVLPAGFFVGRDRVRPAAGIGEERRNDALRSEVRFWAGKPEGPFTGGPLPYQREGFLRFSSTAMVPGRIDASAAPLPPGELTEALAAAVSGPEGVRFSPTGLEIFAACPFKFLLCRVLGIVETSFDINFENHLLAGNLYHEAFGGLLREIAADGVFRGENPERCRSLVPPLVERLFSGLTRRDEYPPSPVRAAWAEKMADDLGIFLQRESELFDGCELRETEKSFDVVIEEAGCGLRGRVDRISARPGEAGLILVDYKTGKPPAKGSVTGDSADPPSVQIPAYVLMLERSGQPVEEALYYSVAEGKFFRVFGTSGKAWLDRPGMDRVTAGLAELLRRSAERVRAGDFSADPAGCEYCEYRSVCRKKYVLERRGGDDRG